jgi:thioredoxin-related protein
MARTTHRGARLGSTSLAAAALLSTAFGTPSRAVAQPVAAKAPAGAKTAGPAGGLEWVDSHDAALQRAKKEKKLVLLDFYTDWCGWCKRLDKEVFADPSFQKEAAGVLAVKVNAEKLPELAQKYQVTSYPRLFVLDSNGMVVERIRGYLNLADFTSKIQQVKKGDTEFSRVRDAAGDPTNMPANQMFARMLSDAKLYDEAIPYWQQVHDLALQQMFAAPGQGANGAPAAFHRESLLELGKAYAAVGLADVARERFQEVLQSYPGSPHAGEAIFGLAKLEMTSPGCGRSAALLQQVVQDYAFAPVAREASLLLPKAQACASNKGGGQ